MPKALIKSLLVDLDIIEQAEFIAENNPEAALRYIDAVDVHGFIGAVTGGIHVSLRRIVCRKKICSPAW